jgi:biopolymer transport protein ExbD
MLRTGIFESARPQEEPSIFRPQLTSLIDVMVFLLIFLVKSFSVQGNVITPSANLELPVSSAQKPPRPTITIEITRGAISGEGRVLATLDSLGPDDSLLIKGVYDWMFVQHAKYADSVKTHEVLIQADREVEYRVLKRVMYSCSKAGSTDFTILAVRKE